MQVLYSTSLPLRYWWQRRTIYNFDMNTREKRHLAAELIDIFDCWSALVQSWTSTRDFQSINQKKLDVDHETAVYAHCSSVK